MRSLPLLLLPPSLALLTCLLLLVIAAYLAAVVPIGSIASRMYHSWKGSSSSPLVPDYVTLSHWCALWQVAVFVSVYVAFVSLNESSHTS
jgi:hypothetical protein